MQAVDPRDVDLTQGSGDPLELEMAICSSNGNLPGESHGQRSLVDYSPWGQTELDTTEYTHTDGRSKILTYR